MDFPLAAGEARPALFQDSSSSSGVPDGCFAALAFCGAYTGLVDDGHIAELLGKPIHGGGILRRELLKERIRLAIIAREVVQFRLLEEEVKRELQIERMLATTRHHEEMISPFGGVPAGPEERTLLTHIAPEIGTGKSVVGEAVTGEKLDREKLFGERLVEERPQPDVPKSSVVKKMTLSQTHDEKKAVESSPPRIFSLVVRKSPDYQMQNPKNKGTVSMPLRDLSLVVTKSPAHQMQTPENRGTVSTPFVDADLGVTKRKASALPREAKKKGGEPMERDWGCALCKVSVTSRVALNEHLQGKRHRANAALLGVVKKQGVSTSARGADGKHFTAPIKEAALQPVKKQKRGIAKENADFLCELCNVLCNSDQMVACHLGGKKHRTRLERSQRKGATITVTGADKVTTDEVHISDAVSDTGAKSVGTGEVTHAMEGQEQQGK